MKPLKSTKVNRPDHMRACAFHKKFSLTARFTYRIKPPTIKWNERSEIFWIIYKRDLPWRDCNRPDYYNSPAQYLYLITGLNYKRKGNCLSALVSRLALCLSFVTNFQYCPSTIWIFQSTVESSRTLIFTPGNIFPTSIFKFLLIWTDFLNIPLTISAMSSVSSEDSLPWFVEMVRNFWNIFSIALFDCKLFKLLLVYFQTWVSSKISSTLSAQFSPTTAPLMNPNETLPLRRWTA